MEPSTTNIITPNTGLVVELTELIGQLRLPESDNTQDALLTRLLKTAHAWAQQYTSRVLLTSQLRSTMPAVTDNIIVLQRGPVTTVEKIEYYAYGSDELTELNADNYQVQYPDLTAQSVVLKATISFIDGYTLPELADRPDAVQITYTSGWATAAAVPEMIKNAILMYAARLYTNPADGVNERASISETLLNNYCPPKL